MALTATLHAFCSLSPLQLYVLCKLYTCYRFICAYICSHVQTMHTGHDLGSIAEGLGDTANPPPSPSGTPNMPPGSTLLGPSPLVRGMSGSGLGRLHRVGSNPINDINRRSFSQVPSNSLVAAWSNTAADLCCVLCWHLPCSFLSWKLLDCLMRVISTHGPC